MALLRYHTTAHEHSVRITSLKTAVALLLRIPVQRLDFSVIHIRVGRIIRKTIYESLIRSDVLSERSCCLLTEARETWASK